MEHGYWKTESVKGRISTMFPFIFCIFSPSNRSVNAVVRLCEGEHLRPTESKDGSAMDMLAVSLVEK